MVASSTALKSMDNAQPSEEERSSYPTGSTVHRFAGHIYSYRHWRGVHDRTKSRS